MGTVEGLNLAVEVHRFIDKVLRRPVDYPGILTRAVPSSMAGLRYPALEDHFLLVLLHAVIAPPDKKSYGDVFQFLRHPGVDWDLVRRRAAAWELTQALKAFSGGDGENLAPGWRRMSSRLLRRLDPKDGQSGALAFFCAMSCMVTGLPRSSVAPRPTHGQGFGTRWTVLYLLRYRWLQPPAGCGRLRTCRLRI